MGSRDEIFRMNDHSTPRIACMVCGTDDRRMLVSGALADGTATVLCASHELIRQRSAKPIEDLDELRRCCGDRRSPSTRRMTAEIDELAMTLAGAFTKEKRSVEDRRK